MRARGVFACLALVLSAAGVTAAAQATPAHSELAILWGQWPHRALVRVDPVSLERVGTDSVPLGRFTGLPAVSLDGRVLAAGVVSGRPALRIVDVGAFRALRDVGLAKEGTIDELAWLDRNHVGVVVRDERGTSVFVVDPGAGTKPIPLRFRDMDVSYLRRSNVGLVALAAPMRRIGRARLLVVGADGSVRSTVVGRIAKGRQERKGRVSRIVAPGLAVDRAGGRAFLAAPDGTVAEVALDDLSVAYHEVRRVSATTAATKDVDGWQLQARFERGTLIVTGYRMTRRAGLASRGLRIIDTRTWTSKDVNPRAGSFAVVGRLVVAASGTGMTAYRLDDRQVWRLEEGKQWSGAYSVTAPYLYVDRNDTKVDVLTIRNGMVVHVVDRVKARPLTDRGIW